MFMPAGNGRSFLKKGHDLMKKAFIKVFTVVSFLVFVSIAGVTSYLVYTSYEKEREIRRAEFPGFRDRVLDWYTEAKSLKSELFIKKMQATIEEEQQLIAVLVYSEKDGILYFQDKKIWNEQSHLKSMKKDAAGKVSYDWNGTPEYINLPPGSIKLSLTLINRSAGDLFIDAIYWPVNIPFVSQYFKWSFFILFVWLILTFIVRLFVSTRSLKEIYETGRLPYGSENSRRSEEDRIAGESYTPLRPVKPEVHTVNRGENLHEVKKESSLSLFSPNTGLGWEDHLGERLKLEINRTASFNQDMVFALIAIDNFTTLDNSFNVYKNVAKIILSSFPFQDLAFEFGQDGYAIILPDHDINQGIKDLETFQRKIVTTDVGGRSVTVTIGASSRAGRLLDENTLMQETRKALKKAQEEGSNRIIAFRADADKYRKMIADKI
jgi:diguanylate cyclase (GGDEF)-like protein